MDRGSETHGTISEKSNICIIEFPNGERKRQT